MATLQRKLTFSALSLVGTFALLEIGLRVAGYDPFGELMRSGRQEPGELLAQDFLRESEHPDLVYELAPGGRAFAWGADVELNAHGFRDEEYPLTAAEGVRRIVALGDSATFGVKLPREVLWPERLEASFAEEGRAVDVLNLGIVGYDVLEEVAFLEKRGLAFAPDLVVLGFHVNDIGYASPTRDYIRRLQSYGSPLYRIRTLQFVRARVDQIEIAREQTRRASDEYFVDENRARIADLSSDAPLLERLEVLRRELEREELSAGSHRYVRWYGSEARIGKLRHALERLAALSAEHGFDVLVFVVPWLGDAGCEDVYDQAYAIVGAEVERVGFEWLDPTAATRAAGHAELRITPEDFGHPNEEGHRILADTLRARLVERGWPAPR